MNEAARAADASREGMGSMVA